MSSRRLRLLSVGLAMSVGLLAALPARSQEGSAAPKRESAKIEAYTGPPIYLPTGDAPPAPAQVQSKVVTENFPNTETVRFERRVVKYSDNSIVSDGSHKEYYSSGQLYVSGEYSVGKAIGKWTYYHPSGKVAKEVTFKDGKPDGPVVVNSPEGKPIARREYAEGRRAGTWESFTPDGEQKLREERYAEGKANGEFKVWYTNGQLRQQINFVDGKREGLATEWSRVGDKRAEVNYRDGKKDGVATIYGRDGKVVKQTYEAGRLVSREG
ncbi:MORN repeat variant [Planctomycetes bacterium MalM25]|nr:MORN repeat variant [Planctomycetes bacterium MalM25]